MIPTGSPSGAPASTRSGTRTPSSHSPAIRSVVSYSDRRDSRLIPASVFPQTARSRICRRAGFVTDTGSVSRRKVISFEGKRWRSWFQMSRRCRPSSSTGLSSILRSDGSGRGRSPVVELEVPVPQRNRS